MEHGRRARATGYAAFLIGTGMGLVTNLVTDNPESWPAPLRPLVAWSWALGG